VGASGIKTEDRWLKEGSLANGDDDDSHHNRFKLQLCILIIFNDRNHF
jgi:hypothetical protein